MYCREIVSVLEKLQKTRDMTYSEVKLTVAIDDPTARDRRAIGIEVGNVHGQIAQPRFLVIVVCKLCTAYFVSQSQSTCH